MAKRAATTSSRKRRTIFTFAWIGALATLGVTALLIVVAVADLAHSQTMSADALQPEKAGASNAGFNNKQPLKSRPLTK